jgi:hypothetical protein
LCPSLKHGYCLEGLLAALCTSHMTYFECFLF